MGEIKLDLVKLTPAALVPAEADFTLHFQRALTSVRDDLRENPYIQEALRVLPVRGYRSAIGNFWNAVVDDLRNKIIHRSLSLFNKSVKVEQEVKSYEDFQSFVNDDKLIEGAYKIGVIGYEASKILKHAKETRHFFDGHPRSSEPSAIKVLSMMDDCIRYVLTSPYPSQIIDIDEYMTVLGTANFDRNEVAVEIASSDLPEIYKVELANRLFTAYVHPSASSTLRGNTEYVIPILWRMLPKPVQLQIVRRVDQEIAKSDVTITEQSFRFVTIVGATSYLSAPARLYKIKPLVAKLKKSLGKFDKEAEAVQELLPYAGIIPSDCLTDYVNGLTLTYVGFIGSSPQFARTNFYSDNAAVHIPRMFEAFDEKSAEAFVHVIKSNEELKGRIRNPAKLGRLRTLANIVSGRVSESFAEKSFLGLVTDVQKEKELSQALYRSSKAAAR
jgi:hypothetical protein